MLIGRKLSLCGLALVVWTRKRCETAHRWPGKEHLVQHNIADAVLLVGYNTPSKWMVAVVHIGSFVERLGYTPLLAFRCGNSSAYCRNDKWQNDWVVVAETVQS